ncbi:MAG: ATP-binding protein [Chloroflexota bacterium]|nr:ATP-binding protein [Dehalococcoidia bacterium]MDW8046830.1 ATP-binding protein [Chloroflexota bacterium]
MARELGFQEHAGDLAAADSSVGSAVRLTLGLARALASADVAWAAWGGDDSPPQAAFDAPDPAAAAMAAAWSRWLTDSQLRELCRAAGSGGIGHAALPGKDEFASWLLAPLAGAEGVLLLARRAAGAFDAVAAAAAEEAALVLGELVRAGAVAGELLRQRNRAAALTEMLASLDPRASTEAVASAAAPVLRQLFGADRCVISRIRGSLREVIGLDTTFPEDDAWLGAAEPNADLDWLGLTKELGYTVVPDLRQVPTARAPRYLRVALEAGVRSVLRARLGPRDAPLGIMSLASRRPNAFTEADGAQLERIGRPLSLALRLAEAREEAETRARRAAEANRVVARIAGAQSHAELCRVLLGDLRALFGAAYAEAFWLPAESGPPCLHVSCEWLDDEGLRRLAETAPPPDHARLLVTDAAAEDSGHPLHRLLVLHGLRSCVRVPLQAEQGVRGHIAVWHTASGAFRDDDLRLLETIAVPAALALARAEADLARSRSEAKYRAAIAQTQQLVVLFDPGDGRIVEVNDYAARALGYEPAELVGRHMADLCTTPPDVLADNIREVLETGAFTAAERRYIRKDGSHIVVDLVASRVDVPGSRPLVIVFGRDISDRVALQRQLIQAQKMESLGQMAGMVAHDFNNILTTILGFASMLKRSPRLNRDDLESLQLIEEAARRAADLSGRLLAFSRGGLVRYGPVDLRDVVRDTLRLAEPALQRLRVEVSLPAAPMIVEGDEGQLQQALLNILLNAADAMPEGGSVAIDAFAEGDTAFLTVADDGPGMDEETRSRIFEPFFTTKPPGQGTGLGLAIVYGIVQAHKGTIAVDSAPGAGTTFLIALPLARQAALPAPRPQAAPEGDLVLVVDDDELVRRTTGTALAHLGFTAVEASNGRTAIELVRARPERFRAVILDLVMPGLTGADTFRGIHAIRPDLPVIICTGYAAEAHLDDELRRTAVAVVQKPFTPERLRQALERAGLAPVSPGR